MKSNKRNRIILILVSLVLFVLLGIGALAVADIPVMEKWGATLEKRAKTGPDKLYAVGKNGKVLQKEIDQAKRFYILSGVNESDAEETSKDYMLKREALYQAAIKNGYTVTDEEIQSYLDEVKEFAQKADNKEDMQSVINQFDSVQAYWEYEFEVYKKNLPIQKYLEDMEEVFKKNQSLKRDNDVDLETEWANYLERLKSELMQEENFEIVK